MSDIEKRFLSRKEAASYLTISSKTLEVHALRGTGPAYSKLGKRIIYDKRDLDRWVEINKQYKEDVS